MVLPQKMKDTFVVVPDSGEDDFGRLFFRMHIPQGVRIALDSGEDDFGRLLFRMHIL